MAFVLHAAAQIARTLGFPGLPVYAKRNLEKLKETFDPNRYRFPSGPERALRADYFSPIELQGGTAEVMTGGVYEQWRATPGGHKWLHYFGIYDSLLGPLRDRPIRMLEIGVYRGASLKMWRQYFPPETLLVGVDIDPTCQAFERRDENVFVRIGSQADEAFLKRVIQEFGPFDVILDDGSHLCSHMIASFRYLFLQALVDDGLYIAEDTHTNFWPVYRDQPYSFIDLCKDLVDVMHVHYALDPAEISYRVGHVDQAMKLAVPRIAAQIKEISFHDSIAVIRKKPTGRLPASQHN